ncbi:VOC family protein [Denitrobaculum tricleocarpae]|uniref:VOC family protein n=1 Tax=Denitrobaculum tricleocarpae TaxID=2591009 RepID=A0A545TXK8_9PROT|nr:VOC family protein [Denitrobaculum tricleocarpae]TQV81966.1 VOC family protein [Denitrobaculum tricleocarpae]
MKQCISAVTLLVEDYDAAISFYCDRVGFELVEDKALSLDKRWVLVAPPGSKETRILLAKADGDVQLRGVGHQTGGRVSFFLQTDDFYRDYERMRANSVVFLETPREEAYGTVAVFQDLYGNKWDLIAFA